MDNTLARKARTLAAASLAALAAASCAGNRETVADRGAEDERRASDTLYIDGTGEVPGGMGGTGDVAPMDPTATDTAGVGGDPNAWPTGPLPSDTGVGGAGTPMPDPRWEETPRDPEAPEAGGPIDDAGPSGNQGPDIW